MNPKVSIIVPIYNVEPYLSRCLDSLLSQSLTEIEIIAVNDGSTDGSLEILKKYKMIDNRVIVIDKENGGVSSARNRGLVEARGEYIGFVDPDDWINREMYQELYQNAFSHHADIVMCTYIREFGTHSKEKKFNLPEKVCYKNEQVKSEILRRLIGPVHEELANPELLDSWGTVWSKIYRADLIKNNEISFVDLNVIGTNEDSLFNIHTVYYANTFVFLNKPFYHYWRANTASVTANYKEDLKDKWSELYRLIEDFLKEKNLREPYYQALSNRICLNTLGLGLNTISRNKSASHLMKIRIIKSILNDSRISKSFKHLEMKYFPLIWKGFFACARWRFASGFYVMLVAIDILRKMVR